MTSIYTDSNKPTESKCNINQTKVPATPQRLSLILNINSDNYPRYCKTMIAETDYTGYIDSGKTLCNAISDKLAEILILI